MFDVATGITQDLQQSWGLVPEADLAPAGFGMFDVVGQEMWVMKLYKTVIELFASGRSNWGKSWIEIREILTISSMVIDNRVSRPTYLA